jgi:hypothetical protein
VALDDAVDIRPGVGEDHACREAIAPFALATDDDAVGERVGLQPELLLGRRGVGQRRIDFDHADLLQQAGSSQRAVGRLRQQIGTERRRNARQRAQPQ